MVMVKGSAESIVMVTPTAKSSTAMEQRAMTTEQQRQQGPQQQWFQDQQGGMTAVTALLFRESA
jgi:hypothetical protein